MRLLISAASGGLFGLGLLVSGMTNPAKVQGWLDFFGDWDPTLAFVLGGAILPMMLAWRLTEGRAPIVGGSFPARPLQQIDRKLVIGSVLFGAGWGMAGLCPGPAMAGLGFGLTGVWIFSASMIAGMIASPWTQRSLDGVLSAR